MSNREVFGGCPYCPADHIINVGRAHWGYCPWHKVRWRIGENLFSGWQEESENEWAANHELLEGCIEVKPTLVESRETIVYLPEDW